MAPVLAFRSSARWWNCMAAACRSKATWGPVPASGSGFQPSGCCSPSRIALQHLSEGQISDRSTTLQAGDVLGQHHQPVGPHHGRQNASTVPRKFGGDKAAVGFLRDADPDELAPPFLLLVIK